MNGDLPFGMRVPGGAWVHQVPESARHRLCELCGSVIPWRKNDRPGAYAKRRFCSNRCRLVVLNADTVAVESQKRRFMQKVQIGQNGDCWRWTGAFVPNGYGYFSLNKKVMHAHRAAFMLFKGAIPAGLYVCHQCDNQWCVNPEHLWPGTQKENIADCIAKGRKIAPPVTNWQNRTKPHHWQRLTEAQAREIIRRLHLGETQASIARQFGVNPSAIYKIKMGLRWPQLARP